MSPARPWFVVLDGVDGCGKSTQARRLAAALSAERGRPALHVREPGSTPLGERIRELLLSRELEIAAPSEALLFAAARRALLDQRVAPALAAGQDVVCERFHASTFAYQSVGGGLEPLRVLELLREWAGSPAPDLTVILDLEVTEAALRRGPAGDRIEDRGLDFQRAVARGYRRYAELDPRSRLVDAAGSEDLVQARVRSCLEQCAAEEARRG